MTSVPVRKDTGLWKTAQKPEFSPRAMNHSRLEKVLVREQIIVLEENLRRIHYEDSSLIHRQVSAISTYPAGSK